MSPKTLLTFRDPQLSIEKVRVTDLYPRNNVVPSLLPRPKRSPLYVVRPRRKLGNGQRKKQPERQRTKLEEPKTLKREDVESKMRSCRAKKGSEGTLNRRGNVKPPVPKRDPKRRGARVRFHRMKNQRQCCRMMLRTTNQGEVEVGMKRRIRLRRLHNVNRIPWPC